MSSWSIWVNKSRTRRGLWVWAWHGNFLVAVFIFVAPCFSVYCLKISACVEGWWIQLEIGSDGNMVRNGIEKRSSITSIVSITAESSASPLVLRTTLLPCEFEQGMTKYHRRKNEVDINWWFPNDLSLVAGLMTELELCKYLQTGLRN